MKKLFLALALIMMVPLFSAMKVIYLDSTGQVVAIGPLVDYVSKDGESVLEDPKAKPEQLSNYIVKGGVFREKTAAEKQADAAAETGSQNAMKAKKQALATKLGLTQDEFATLRAILREK